MSVSTILLIILILILVGGVGGGFGGWYGERAGIYPQSVGFILAIILLLFLINLL